MNVNATKIASIAILATALIVWGWVSGISAFFSTSPAPSGCTDSGYGFQAGFGYGYDVNCPSSSWGWGGGGWGSSSSSSRDYCPNGDTSGNFRDGRCEMLITTTSTDSDTDMNTNSDADMNTDTVADMNTDANMNGNTGSSTTTWTDTNVEVPSSLLDLIKARNETTGGSTNTTWSAGTGIMTLPSSLPNTGTAK